MKGKEQKITCPVCRKASPWDGNAFRPFCSERCRLIDLGKWASEDYRIAGEEKDMTSDDISENNQIEK